MTDFVRPGLRDVTPRAELREAFDAWVAQHSYVWFEGDLRLAQAIASDLGVNLEIDGVAVAPDDIPGVTQG